MTPLEKIRMGFARRPMDVVSTQERLDMAARYPGCSGPAYVIAEDKEIIANSQLEATKTSIEASTTLKGQKTRPPIGHRGKKEPHT